MICCTRDIHLPSFSLLVLLAHVKPETPSHISPVLLATQTRLICCSISLPLTVRRNIAIFFAIFFFFFFLFFFLMCVHEKLIHLTSFSFHPPPPFFHTQPHNLTTQLKFLSFSSSPSFSVLGSPEISLGGFFGRGSRAPELFPIYMARNKGNLRVIRVNLGRIMPQYQPPDFGRT